MLGAVGRTIGRIMIILVVAGAISGGVYAASRSSLATAQFRGGPRGDFAGAPAAGSPNSSPGTTGRPPRGPGGPGGDFGGNRNSASLTRGLPDLLINIVEIGLLIAGVSYIQSRMKRRKRRTSVQAVG